MPTTRTSVHEMAEGMEAVLKKNDHKGGWGHLENHSLLSKLEEEVKELKTMAKFLALVEELDDSALYTILKGEATFHFHKRVQAALCKEAIDVANFCMMLVDNNKPPGENV